MSQMYKIFMNEIPVVILEGNPSDTEGKGDRYNPVLFFNQREEIKEAFERVESGVYVRSLTIVGEDAKQIRNELFKEYKQSVAAGGVVINKKGELLLIYRHSMWDLPKGKLESGETIEEASLREVEEETGLKGMKLKDYLIQTYHTYVAAENEKVLKKTHWFLMSSKGKGTLKPQIEEGIEAAIWVNPEMLKSKMERTYGNIKIVLDQALLRLHLLQYNREQDVQNSPDT